jgi:hypothetical protein
MFNVLEIEGNSTPIFALIGVAALLGAGIGMGLYGRKANKKAEGKGRRNRRK